MPIYEFDHWKHTLSAIRILDLIPGREATLVE